jgi:ACS family hexuronate transporter-like MFS transporter
MRKIGKYRWRICALLFFATTINYIDRQVLGILAPQLQEEFGWSDSAYGFIVTSFQVAYAIGFLFLGNIIDKIGTRLGYTISIIFWSIAAILHSFARSVTGFAIARLGLGLGEAGNFPSAVKAVAEWFPTKERALATGIFVSGSSIGAMIAPLTVPFIAINYGWQSAFVFTGLLGFIWLIFWLMIYRSPEKHPKVTKEELAYIKSDPPIPQIKRPWLELLKYRQTWAFTIGKFLTDPVFSFFFFFCQSSFIPIMASTSPKLVRL